MKSKLNPGNPRIPESKGKVRKSQEKSGLWSKAESAGEAEAVAKHFNFYCMVIGFCNGFNRMARGFFYGRTDSWLRLSIAHNSNKFKIHLRKLKLYQTIWGV